jgi:hypothetical protein
MFCFRENIKAINGFNAAFIHGFIAAEKLADENKPVIDPNSFTEIFDRLIF